MNLGHLDWLISKFDCVTNWKDFGVHLKVPYCECSKIEADYSKCSDRLRETVACWLNNTVEANSVDLINALNKIGEKKLAHDIQQEICQGNSTFTCMLSIHDFNCLSLLVLLSHFTLQKGLFQLATSQTLLSDSQE